MAEIKFNFEQYDGQIAKSCMARLKEAAGEVKSLAVKNCQIGTISRPIATKGKNAGQIWTKREIGALRRTIRVTTGPERAPRLDQCNVRVYAGNFKTWYAIQVEYGRGAWKGGAHPFMRPALDGSKSRVQSILENGSGETR